MKQEKLKDPRKRKMLLVLPLFVIPFLTMAFWALGGGTTNLSATQKQSAGLNLQLPNAQLKDDQDENKLSYYEQAEKDSLKWKEVTENDPFFSSSLNDATAKNPLSYHPYPLQTGEYKDPNEQKVYKKLEELNQHLQNPVSYSSSYQNQNSKSSFKNTSFDSDDVNRLEEMMKRTSSPNTKDPEVDQLNSMMDRILDIQHPERVKQRISEKSSNQKEQVFSVRSNTIAYSISLLDTSKTEDRQNEFYGVEANGNDVEQNAIEAVIHETQSLVDGSIVKIRLLEDITINAVTVLRGNFVFGKASLEGERLGIEIKSIRKDNSLFPVKLTVYDLDGMEGIHIPGAITRDVAKQSADNSLQNIEMGSIDPSLKAQATSAGINAAKSLLAKKAKLVKVTVKAGYKILLKQKMSNE
ncbi:MAG TPA: conjugative transposon protein TraM [Flavisolibacter sp.]|nr:conjugative transposon protein TraM [Flavisolibacter sp.]